MFFVCYFMPVPAAAAYPSYSGIYSGRRGLEAKELESKPYQFTRPAELVQLSLEHDRLFVH